MVDAETDVEVKKYWALRENFWIDRILDYLSENILFLCGHEHVLRLMKSLTDRGIDVFIIDRFWRRDLFSDYNKLGLS